MPPSRGLLSSALTGTRLQPKCRTHTLNPAYRSFSTRPLSNRTIQPSLRPSSSRPSLNVRIQVAGAPRALSLWPFGSGASREGNTSFADQHKATAANVAEPETVATSTPHAATTSAHPSSISPTTEPTAVSTSPTPDTTPLDIQLLNIDEITPVVPDIHTLTEKIGHFNELGLNFGWGLTSIIGSTLEYVHVYTGLPWWGSILVTSSFFRAVQFYFIRKQSDQMARAAPYREETKAIQMKRMQAGRSGDALMLQEAKREYEHLKKHAGLDMKWQILPLAVQMYAGFCTFRFYRAAAEVPIPGWQTGGFGWITDLNLTDPLYITPVLFAGLMHVIGRLGGESGMGASGQMNQPGMRFLRPAMLYVLPGIVGISMLWMPVALQLSFITSMTFGIAQSYAFRNPYIREKLKMAPITYLTNNKSPAVTDFIRPNISNNIRVAPTYQAPGMTAGAQAAARESKAAKKGGYRGAVENKMQEMKKSMNEAGDDFRKRVDEFRGIKEDTSTSRSELYKKQAAAYEERHKRNKRG